MKIGEETIYYQHQQAQDILEKLLKGYLLPPMLRKDIKEAIEWITKANDSAIKTEDKLKWYKQNDINSK